MNNQTRLSKPKDFKATKGFTYYEKSEATTTFIIANGSVSDL